MTLRDKLDRYIDDLKDSERDYRAIDMHSEAFIIAMVIDELGELLYEEESE